MLGGREKQGGNRVCISLEERLDMQRARTLRHDGSPKSNIMDDHLKIVESGGEGREVRAKIEMDSSNKKGKKKKRQGNREKEVRSGIRREKGKGISDREEAVVNASLFYSNISNRKNLILREAKKAWEVKKRLGFSIRGDGRELVDEVMRLEGL
ncbi:hypothetical protein GOBAR_AA34806 [Gossypium barbadense]|uniref:Uncharacterized protein n=1 Tax=Gossypium barbadense TaxID=3634 RepID=A0A2P5W454_GOSBA|nr:hypothetical protein GOBAR_AA34806 [Gossypium barbadense]